MRILTSLFSIGLLSLSAAAIAEEERNFSVGVTTSGLTLATDGFEDDEASGLGVTASAYFQDTGRFQLGGRATLAFMEHDDLSGLDVTTFDASLLWGQGFNAEGFKWYLSGGIFNDKWSYDVTSFSENFNGLQLGGGIGYNWDRIALDGWLTARNTSSYKFYDLTPESVITGGISLSYRF